MTGSDPKDDLRRYLQAARDAMLWKLEGLADYDIRRPLTPTGTNLLGLVKHLASIEFGYFGEVFGRPPANEDLWWNEQDDDPNADMWATAEESREDIVALYRRAWAHSDATISELDLDAPGEVPWWSEERRRVTLHQILVHLIADMQRHVGHADILRELIDGSVGLRATNSNLPEGDEAYWSAYRAKLEQVAREVGDRPAP
jgi:uncharacterized damage-inducible protein DinB